MYDEYCGVSTVIKCLRAHWQNHQQGWYKVAKPSLGEVEG